MIRAIPTTSTDRIYCKILAHNAVHAAFAGASYTCRARGRTWLAGRGRLRAVLARCTAGFTGLTVGLVNTHYVLLPIPVVIQAPRKARAVLCCGVQGGERASLRPHASFLSSWRVQVDPRGKAWNRLRASIGQPNFA